VGGGPLAAETIRRSDLAVRVTLVVPVLNVEPQLRQTLDQLRPVREVQDLEILIVVDVPDARRHREVVEEHQRIADEFGISVLYRVGQRGFGSALRHGFAMASGEAVIPLMADASDDPRDILRFVEKLAEGWDVVAGSRYMLGGRIVGNTMKQRLSRMYGRLVWFLGNLPVRDASNSFKAYRREVIDSLTTRAESYDISAELTVKAHQAGFRVTEIPTVWTNRQLGKSHWRFLPEVRRYGRWLALAAVRGRVPSRRGRDRPKQDGRTP
jgi:glycosyltransferase involved in cell wall biosynthesis